MKRKLSLLALGGLSFVPALGGCGNSLSFPQANSPVLMSCRDFRVQRVQMLIRTTVRSYRLRIFVLIELWTISIDA